MMLQLLLNKTALKASGCVFKLCRNVRFFNMKDTTTFTLCNCNVTECR